MRICCPFSSSCFSWPGATVPLVTCGQSTRKSNARAYMPGHRAGSKPLPPGAPCLGSAALRTFIQTALSPSGSDRALSLRSFPNASTSLGGCRRGRLPAFRLRFCAARAADAARYEACCHQSWRSAQVCRHATDIHFAPRIDTKRAPATAADFGANADSRGVRRQRNECHRHHQPRPAATDSCPGSASCRSCAAAHARTTGSQG